MFEEQFLAKFGDDRITATLINDFPNLKAKLGEKIKNFNSRFNKLLNKIPATSLPGVDVKIEWYILSLPSNLAFFVDREKLPTLAKNMKESLSVEKHITTLEKKNYQEDRKRRRRRYLSKMILKRRC